MEFRLKIMDHKSKPGVSRNKMSGNKQLWAPSKERIESSKLHEFSKFAKRATPQNEFDFGLLYRWSVEEIGDFWQTLEKFANVIGQQDYQKAYVSPGPGRMLGAEWFVGGKINFAENFLWRRGGDVALTALPDQKALDAANRFLRSNNITGITTRLAQ